MDFQEFLRFVPKLIDARLPAFDAHIKMAPLERLESLRNSSFGDKKPRMAAVMMLFYPKNNSTHLVLIVRNSYEGVHSAQIAFPGGKCEFEDENFACTALRETHEEIGIRPDKIEILKPFTELYIRQVILWCILFWVSVKKNLCLYPSLPKWLILSNCL